MYKKGSIFIKINRKINITLLIGTKKMKSLKELENKNMKKTIKELMNKKMKTLKEREKYYYSVIFLSSAIQRSMRAVHALSCARIDSISI